jgi:hypothetical protein
LLNVVGTIGDAAGSTICAVIWTTTFRKALIRNLPASAMPRLDVIYEKLDIQLSYPVGSPTRRAIQNSYGYAQTRMLAAGTGLMALAFAWVLMIRDIRLDEISQVKGMVF